MAEVNFGWHTTSPNPNRRNGGYDAGQRGWRLHAVLLERDEPYSAYKRRPALCGAWPRHGWGLDLFITDECQRCSAKMTEREAAGDVFIDLPALIAAERQAAEAAKIRAEEQSDDFLVNIWGGAPGVRGMDGAEAAAKLREGTRQHGHCPICHALYPQHHANCTAGVEGTPK